MGAIILIHRAKQPPEFLAEVPEARLAEFTALARGEAIRLGGSLEPPLSGDKRARVVVVEQIDEEAYKPYRHLSLHVGDYFPTISDAARALGIGAQTLSNAFSDARKSQVVGLPPKAVKIRGCVLRLTADTK